MTPQPDTLRAALEAALASEGVRENTEWQNDEIENRVLAAFLVRHPAVSAALTADHATLGYWFARVEAALPEGTYIVGLTRDFWKPSVPEWFVTTQDDSTGKTEETGVYPTPEAALQALHAALTKEDAK